jgi:hypothetical protein
MNIVQLHEQVRYWLDIVTFPRVSSTDIDNALNISTENLITEKYDQTRLNHRGDSFQRTQRIRDELKPLVKGDNWNIATLAIANAQFPADYRYLLALKIKDDVGVYHNCYPMTYDEEFIVSRNPFRKAKSGAFERYYYNEYSEGIRLLIPVGVTLGTTDAAWVFYLANPAIIVYGVEYDSGHTFAEGNIVYAVTETVYDSVTYPIGSAITIVAGHLTITSGTVVFGYTNSNLPVSLHNEIAKMAAANICEITGAYEKSKTIKADLIAT